MDTEFRGAALRDAHCPVETTLAVIGGRWKPLILFHLRSGPRRFNELRRLIPQVTQRMLTQHLRELERDRIVSRTVHAEVPPHVDYAFTAQGRTLLPLLEAMAAWGTAYARMQPADAAKPTTVPARTATKSANGVSAAEAPSSTAPRSGR